MKTIILFLLLISLITFAKTRGDLKSDLGSFAKSNTSSSSSSDDDDDDDDNDSSYSSNNSNSSSEYNRNNYNNSTKISFSGMWFWEKFYFPERSHKKVEKESRILYLSSSYNHQSWKPTGINNAKLDTTELNFTKFELALFFNSLYFSYETSFDGANLAKQRELLEIREDKKHAWERFLSEIVLPFTITLNNKPFARVYLSYDEQVFISTVTSLEEKYYIPRTESGKSDNESVDSLKISAGDKIVTETLFKNWHLGFRMDYHHAFKSNLGFFALSYNKPYSLTIDDKQMDEQIHDTDFDAYGLFIDLIFDSKFFHLRTGFKLGGGKVNLVGLDTKVDDLVDEDFSTMYFQFNGDIGLFYDVTENIRIESLFKMEYRNFYLSRSDSNEDDDIDDSASFDLNSDYIFTFYAGISYSF